MIKQREFGWVHFTVNLTSKMGAEFQNAWWMQHEISVTFLGRRESTLNAR